MRRIVQIIAALGRDRTGPSRRARSADPVTGLMTARPFMARLKGLWPRNGVLLLITADQYDQICAEEGPEAGDALLNTIAVRIAENTRSADLAARIGRNLFAVHLRGAERIHALRIAARLARTIPHSARPETSVTLAIGGAEVCGAVTPVDLVEQARSAMATAGPEQPRFWPRLAMREYVARLGPA